MKIPYHLTLLIIVLIHQSCYAQRFNWTKPADINRGLPSSV
jgi:hypothetical protein